MPGQLEPCTLAPLPVPLPREGLSNNNRVRRAEVGRGRIIQDPCQPPSIPHPNQSQRNFCLQAVEMGEREGRGTVAAHPAQSGAGTAEGAGAHQAVKPTSQAYISVFGAQIQPSAHPKVGSPWHSSYSTTFLMSYPLFWVPIPYYHIGLAITPFDAIVGKTLPCQLCHLSQLVPSLPPPTAPCLVPLGTGRQ